MHIDFQLWPSAMHPFRRTRRRNPFNIQSKELPMRKVLTRTALIAVATVPGLAFLIGATATLAVI
jgi:hypothetical protein